jgi:hypothetical protein
MKLPKGLTFGYRLFVSREQDKTKKVLSCSHFYSV